MQVVLIERSETSGQGVKICPYTNVDELKKPHVCASTEVLAQQLQSERNTRQLKSSPKQQLFKKTCAYFTALENQGCMGPPHEVTIYTGGEANRRKEHLQEIQKRQRGHLSKIKCNGRLLFEYDHAGQAFVRSVTNRIPNMFLTDINRCEHYNRRQNIDHLIDYDIGKGLYDLQYLEALFLDDHDAIEELEEGAADVDDVGPLATCTTVASFSSVKVNCRMYFLL